MRSTLAVVLLAAIAVACARTKVEVAAVEKHGGAGEFAEMDFWDAVAKQPAICNSDAIHALMLSFGVKDPGGSDSERYAARLAACRERGWIGGKDELFAQETARVGWIAKAICIETGIKGGVTMRVFGPRERYAVSELNYRRWLANMTPYQSISGIQLMALLGAAEDFQSGPPSTVMEGAK
ncbi:MAG: hypothetical protein ACYTGZ_15515 [Planctomycetota bacterium]